MVPKIERFEMRLESETLERVDAWRATQGDMPSRAEAVRRLIDRALAAPASKSVTFSDGEKAIVLLLGDLFKRMKVESDMDPAFLAKAIYGGHLWSLGWKYTGVYHGHEDKMVIVHEVVDILDMWFFIEAGYTALTKREKERVESCLLYTSPSPRD